ncbi:MAG: alcohol dehydrogenase, partial [Planctomycetaceae bacterium]
DGKLLVLAENGDLVMVAESSQGFQELGRSEFLEGRCWTAPALSGGMLFGRNADGLLKCVLLPQ